MATGFSPSYLSLIKIMDFASFCVPCAVLLRVRKNRLEVFIYQNHPSLIFLKFKTDYVILLLGTRVYVQTKYELFIIIMCIHSLTLKKMYTFDGTAKKIPLVMKEN